MMGQQKKSVMQLNQKWKLEIPSFSFMDIKIYNLLIKSEKFASAFGKGTHLPRSDNQLRQISTNVTVS